MFIIINSQLSSTVMFRMCQGLCHSDDLNNPIEQIKLQSKIYKPQTPLKVSTIKEVRDKYDELARDKHWLEETDAYDVVDKNSTYFGSVYQNKPHGFGRLANQDGSLYEGQFNEGVGEGEGSLYIYPDGSYYKGNIKNSRASGKGVFVYKNEELIYKGDWQRDLPHGSGEERLSDGSVYEGDFIEGLKSGKGIFVWPNGDRYEGQFLSGLMDGEGTFVSKEKGYKYVGNWQKNEKNGEGTQYFKDGTVIRCNFENGFRIGTVIVTKDGVQQEGEQRQGRFFVSKNKST